MSKNNNSTEALDWSNFPGGLSVVIPVYNEKNTIKQVIDLVEDTGLVTEIVLVDDGSTDGTREVLEGAKKKGRQIIFHEKNQGKGAAVRTAFKAATGDIILVQDADFEYDPADYPALLTPILSGKADVVYGSRFLGGPHRVLFFWHYVVNRFLTLLSNILTNINLTDMEVGYKVFRKEVLEKITIKSNRFNFEPEITAKIAKQKIKIYEVPISYHGRTYEEGKKIGPIDGLEALWTIFKYRFMD